MVQNFVQYDALIKAVQQIDPNQFNNYLILGYVVMWLVVMVYLAILANRQKNAEITRTLINVISIAVIHSEAINNPKIIKVAPVVLRNSATGFIPTPGYSRRIPKQLITAAAIGNAKCI